MYIITYSYLFILDKEASSYITYILEYTRQRIWEQKIEKTKIIIKAHLFYVFYILFNALFFLCEYRV